jgi:hypothetical protein
MGNRTKSTVNQSEKDHFSLHAQCNASMPGIAGHDQCSFPLSLSRQQRLSELNPIMFEWLDRCTHEYENICRHLDSINGVPMFRKKQSLFFELHSFKGTNVLLSFSKEKVLTRRFFSKLLTGLPKDRQLLSDVIGSAFLGRTHTYHGIEIEGRRFYIYVSGKSSEQRFIAIKSFSSDLNVYLPRLDLWPECGLDWLIDDYQQRCC